MDNTRSAETERQLLINLLDINIDDLIEQAIQKSNLKIIETDIIQKGEDDNQSDLVRITLNNGRVYEHSLKIEKSGDGWIHKHYDFILKDAQKRHKMLFMKLEIS